MEKQPHPAWGVLISEPSSQVNHREQCKKGESAEFDFCLVKGDKDVQTRVTRPIFTLRLHEKQGENESTLQFTGKEGSLRLNDTVCGELIQLLGEGDELIISTSDGCKYQYIFRMLEYSSFKASLEHIADLHAYVRRYILDVEDIDVCFETFPYCLSESTKDGLIYTTYLQLEYFKVKEPMNIPFLCSRILLLDQIGSVLYQETLIKALAKHCSTRLLILNPILLTGETAAVDKLFKAIADESNMSSLILFLKALEREKPITNVVALEALKLELKSLPRNILLIASQTDDPHWLSISFPTKVTIQIPKSKELRLREELDRDNKRMISQSNVDNICSVLNYLGMSTNLENLSIKDEALTSAESVTISRESVEFALDLWKKMQKISQKSLKDVISCNDRERSILEHVIPSGKIGVCFDDIGALEEVKQILFESVILPLQRPEWFGKGLLAKACKGILLFGPPGTGKTMLAKAIATEAGANFLSITMSSVLAREFGESAKNVQVIFSVAKKLAPTIIFFDEVDSILSSREYLGQGQVADEMRRVKIQFLMNWDGLLTNDGERVLILGATNRPFDLDHAAIRRFSRRLMVSLPDERNRAKILQCILKDEELAQDFDFEQVAKFTHEYSGSDLKNLCIAAVHCRLRERLERVRKDKSSGDTGELLRPISMEDMEFASRQVRPSTPSESITMKNLFDWNDEFGEGGSPKTQTLSYII